MDGVQVGRGGSRGKVGWLSVQSMGEMGKDFCPNFLQPFLENVDRRSCNDRSRELIPVFHNPRTLEYLVAVEFGSISKRPLNILKAVIRSARRFAAARNEGPVATASLHREVDA